MVKSERHKILHNVASWQLYSPTAIHRAYKNSINCIKRPANQNQIQG